MLCRCPFPRGAVGCLRRSVPTGPCSVFVSDVLTVGALGGEPLGAVRGSLSGQYGQGIPSSDGEVGGEGGAVVSAGCG